MRPPPAITVCILTHNYARYVGGAVESVLRQTCPDWDLIVCDDASTDDTAAVVAPFLNDERIRYVRHARNLGQAGNWAFALDQGSAPVVAVLHADDEWLPDTLATAREAFAVDPELDLFFGRWWRDEGMAKGRTLISSGPPVRTTGRRFVKTQITRNPVLPSAAFLSRHVIESAGRPSASYRMVVDFEYFARVSAASRHVRSTDAPLCIYRVHSASTTAKTHAEGSTPAENDRMAVELPVILKKSGVGPFAVGALRAMLARSEFDRALVDVINGRSAGGARKMRSIVWRRWSVLLRPRYAIDYLLSSLGPAGTPLLRRLHPGRIEHDRHGQKAET